MSHLVHIKEQMAGEPVHVQRCVWEGGSDVAGPVRGWVQTAARALCSPPWKGIRPQRSFKCGDLSGLSFVFLCLVFMEMCV